MSGTHSKVLLPTELHPLDPVGPESVSESLDEWHAHPTESTSQEYSLTFVLRSGNSRQDSPVSLQVSNGALEM